MRARIVSVLAASAVAFTGLLVGASPASATSDGALALSCQDGFFCAYINVNYNGQILKSNAGSGQRVQVAGGTSSGSNATSNNWTGVNELSGLPDDDIFTWAPGTDANLGSAQNDKINYFNVG